MRFSYTATTPGGKISSGTIDAANRRAAVALLSRQQLVVVKLAAASRVIAWQFGRLPLLQRLLIAQHLSTLLAAGVSLLEALKVIGDEARGRRFKRGVAKIAEQVSAGQTLAAALEAQGAAFDPLFIGLVRVGEASGTLTENLRYLAGELADQHALHGKVRSALIYPAVVVAVTGVVGLLLTYWVLPKIVPLFVSLKVTLPWPTRLLLKFATFIRTTGLLSLGVAAAVAVALQLTYLVPTLRLAWHRMFLHLPLVGRITRNLNLASTSRTLGTLLKSGIPLTDSLLIASRTSRNLVYQCALLDLREGVTAGRSLTAAVAAYRGKRLFPSLTLSLLRVGEAGGSLDESLLYLSRFYEREVDGLVKDLAVIIEPTLLLFIGLAVALVASAIIMPIYEISGSLRIR